MNRHLLKSVQFAKTDFDKLDQMRELVEQAGFNVKYYTGIHSNFDLPYDFYRPTSDTPRTQIEIIQKDGTLYELSELSPLVASLTVPFMEIAAFISLKSCWNMKILEL